MSINGISTGYTAGYETGKTQNAVRGNAFASQIGQSVNAAKVTPFSSESNYVKTNRNSAMEAYLASSAYGVRDVK